MVGGDLGWVFGWVTMVSCGLLLYGGLLSRLLALVVLCFGLLFSLVVVGLRLLVLVVYLWIWVGGWIVVGHLLSTY